jgi:hypothetical protein
VLDDLDMLQQRQHGRETVGQPVVMEKGEIPGRLRSRGSAG